MGARRRAARRIRRSHDRKCATVPCAVLIAGDQPVTAEQVREKLQSDGWSNVVVLRNGRYIEATGSLNGQAGKMAVDSQTGRLRADDDDDDDD